MVTGSFGEDCENERHVSHTFAWVETLRRQLVCCPEGLNATVDVSH